MVYVSDSKIHGKGLISKKDISKDEIVLDYRPYLKDFIKLKWNELNEFQINHNWNIDIDGEYCLTHNGLTEIHFINHSREPNTVWKIPEGLIIANRDIKANDEITIDYRTEIRPTRTNWPEWI